MAVDPLESPCIGVCTIAADTGLCCGCLRTIDEIARWRAMDRGERTRVLAACAVRQPRAD
ncbi:MAG: DUF1289 domain-containing protein [Proteobacteria bacterium]|nr:DUF1289 domain-containing protein [Pseudomonadota bacterium]